MARVPYVTKNELSPTKKDIYDQIQKRRGHVPMPISVLLHQPQAAAKVAALGEYARFDTSLDPVVRETTILAVARETNCQYEWAHHAPLAERAGVREEVIEAIRDRRAPNGLPPEEGVFVQYVQELLRTGVVSDATFQAVLDLLGPAGIVDLAVTVGYYGMLAQIAGSFEVELEEDRKPLLPE